MLGISDDDLMDYYQSKPVTPLLLAELMIKAKFMHDASQVENSCLDSLYQNQNINTIFVENNHYGSSMLTINDQKCLDQTNFCEKGG